MTLYPGRWVGDRPNGLVTNSLPTAIESSATMGDRSGARRCAVNRPLEQISANRCRPRVPAPFVGRQGDLRLR